jgi:hypothetical protein
MDERRAKIGDRIIYRAQNGEDIRATIVGLSSEDVATLALDNGMRVSGVDHNKAGEGAAFLNSWTLLDRFVTPAGEDGPMWTEALSAGIVTVMLDIEAGRIPADQRCMRALLESFRAGVGMVLEIQREE